MKFTLNGEDRTSDVTNLWPARWLDFVAKILQAESHIDVGWEFLKDSPGYDPEEQWELPEKDVNILITMDDISLPISNFSIGRALYCEYKGIYFLCEQNASPFMFYRKIA